MPIDFSFLDGDASQGKNTPSKSDTANVIIRVDADSLLLCDGEYIDHPFKAGVLTKIQLPLGQHLLEFLSEENPDLKVEKEVDFPEVGKSYLVLIKGLKDLVEEEARVKAEAEARRKAEEETKRQREEAKRKAKEKSRAKAEAEARRKAEEEAQRLAEEAKRKAEEAKMLKERSGAINGHDYVDLGLPSGLKWATCNVGASSPEEYGDNYAWGEVNTKSQYTSETCKTYDKKINDISGNSTYDVARKNWGSSWRMPTDSEFSELWRSCKWQWTTKGGTNGFKAFGPNGNTLFLPAAGIRIDEKLCHAGKEGHYWSSIPENVYGYDTHAYYMIFYNFCYKTHNTTYRHYGCSVRPVSE